MIDFGLYKFESISDDVYVEKNKNIKPIVMM